MLRVLLLILLIPIGFVAVRVGWPWAIAVITVTVAFYGLYFLKDAPGKTRVVFFLSAFVLQALAIAWGIRWTLQQVELAVAQDDISRPVFEGIAGSDLLQNFWAIVGGVVAAAIMFGLLFALAAMANATRHAPQEGQSRDNIYARSLRRALGLVPAEWVARDGKIVTTKAPKPPQQPLMGPGEIEVQRGHAIILEKEGVVTDVLPAGVHWVQSQERIAMLVPLYGGSEKVLIRNASTKDGLQIEDLEISVFHKVNGDGADPKIVDDKSRFNDSVLRNKVWSASGSSWAGGITAVAERQARDVIAGYDMDQLVTMNTEAREQFRTKIQERINQVTDEFMGVTVTVTGVGTVNVPDLAAEKLMARWTTAQDRAMAREQAAQQNEIMMDAAKARKEAFDTLVGAMNDWLERGLDVKDLVAMSFVERMERIEGEPPSGANQDLEALSKLYVIEALKAITGRQTPPEGAAET
jgi:regulator of protease activity HflC (stomatin/prohibitin superfamily)